MMPSVVSIRVGTGTSVEVEWQGDHALARVAEGYFFRETALVPRRELAATLRRLADALDHEARSA